MSGPTTSGQTNRTTDGDFAVLPLLCPSDAVGSAAENSVSSESGVSPAADSCWRTEVAARLERYRTRRKPRTPRYPSLLLPFDSPGSWSRPAHELKIEPAEAEPQITFETDEQRRVLAEPACSGSGVSGRAFSDTGSTLEQFANVIEFPRSAAIPVFQPSDLAD